MKTRKVVHSKDVNATLDVTQNRQMAVADPAHVLMVGAGRTALVLALWLTQL